MRKIRLKLYITTILCISQTNYLNHGWSAEIINNQQSDEIQKGKEFHLIIQAQTSIQLTKISLGNFVEDLIEKYIKKVPFKRMGSYHLQSLHDLLSVYYDWIQITELYDSQVKNKENVSSSTLETFKKRIQNLYYGIKKQPEYTAGYSYIEALFYASLESIEKDLETADITENTTAKIEVTEKICESIELMHSTLNPDCFPHSFDMSQRQHIVSNQKDLHPHKFLDLLYEYYEG